MSITVRTGSIVTTLTLAVFGAAAAQAEPIRACTDKPDFMNPLMYPSVEQLADSRLLFRLCAPDASAPRVVSSDIEQIPSGFDGKPAGLAMTRDAQGYWVATTATPVRAGTYAYGFRVAGLSVLDPQADRFSLNYRGANAVVEVKGPEGAFQSYDPAIPHGAVSVIEYPSKTLGQLRRAHVYTPPGYEKGGNKRYPVLYLVHGAGDSDDSWTSRGRAHYILDKLIASGKAKPMIVVMPAGHTEFKPGSDLFMNKDFGDDLVQDLVPLIDRTYRTIAKPETRAMAGLSMGGAHTLAWGLPNPETFGPIGVFSMGFFQPGQSEKYVAANDAALRRRGQRNWPVYFAMGKTDFLYAGVAPTRAMMDRYGIKYNYVETEGGHTWANWRNYIHEYYQIILK
ncbi:MAG: esterase [Alphaproteobacteria bacterium HGW-Alphaproteobacteria-16]|nr:MAG: esterase [Alphaproteobacteria bacterium HGW-Alphaproteobacteria-16]